MATPPMAFQLDRNIFNNALYTRLQKFWFEDLSPNATAPTFNLLQKWYGMDRTDDEKAIFDQECRKNFGPAVDSIGPSRLILPPFQGYDCDIENANTIAAPFVQEVRHAQEESRRKGAETLLSLFLLLDQLPRNIFRDKKGLALVYGHYDRLAFSLLHASKGLAPNPLEYEHWRGKPVKVMWTWLPLIHSEHLPSHKEAQRMSDEVMMQCQEAKDEDAIRVMAASDKARLEHLIPIQRFGRYPHRNECLDRRTTAEEEEYLKTANTFGVKQSQKQEHKNEP
ncbi:hypothetical protein M433DRAFT_154639 [Acidomyces richmondensis BFW]|nr:MAG: hypothetical protein FE78DRAFT_90894 [Acidomyces sp. 'richmondensis']KYG45344.1 hypothetical protein M433DRAFT_154639 [Acidomyces richmondensis BFW]